MRTEEKDGNVYVREIEDFHLGQTLECGQCFHFAKIGDNEYVLSAKKRFLHVLQDKNGDLTFFNTDLHTFNDVWRGYFDLDRDYGEIKRWLLSKDDKLKPAMESMWGVRILNQDFFETMISFIISQNNQIPRIKKIVWELSERYGKAFSEAEQFNLSDSRGVAYSFPEAKDLIAAGVEGMREAKTGFRAPYIIAACNRFEDSKQWENELIGMEYDEALKSLTEVKGIGDKVANCILLFSLGKRNAFPVDVWIKRSMESIYIGHEADKNYIRKLAEELFGEYGGYAQQYIFYFGKENKIGL